MFPVTITLHDASQLNAVLAALGNAPAAQEAPAPAPKAQKAKPAATQPAVEQAQKAVAAPAPVVESPSDPKPVAEPSAPAATAAPAASSIDYATLQKAVFKLAGLSREETMALAKSFGVGTFKELPETKWPEALIAVNAKIAELEVA